MKSKLLLIVLLSLFFVLPDAQAKTTCANWRPGVQKCSSEVDFSRFSSSYASQKMSQWCWAACISMIFDYHGHPLSQETIVNAQYGRTVNLPAMNGYAIASKINRDWVDDNGKRFRARLTAAWDPAAEVYAMNNFWIIQQLHLEMPFIIGFGGHAVVVTRADYYRDIHGSVQVESLGVFDPWPGNGARTLSGSDIVVQQNGGKFQFAASTMIESYR